MPEVDSACKTDYAGQNKPLMPFGVQAKGSKMSAMLQNVFNGMSNEAVAQPVRDNDLILAASAGKADLVSALLENGADPTVGNHSAFSIAAANGHLQVVRLLLIKNPNPEIIDKALCKAADRGYADVVALLLSSGSNPTTKQTAIDLARREKILRPEVLDVRRETPRDGHKRTIQILSASF